MAKDERIALVTGGTGGIGTAICRALADAGAKVASAYHTAGKGEQWQAEQKQAGYDFHVVHVNIGDFDSCAKMIEDVTTKLGPINILINNAGVTRDSTLKNMTLEKWQQVVNTNLDSIFNATKHVIDSMLERKFGRIINIASINGQKGQMGQCNYAAAKSGIHGFTKSLALEVAKKGITVNTVSPGYIATDMVMAVPETIREKIIATIPVGRLGEPEEIAELVAFLASDKSNFITGADFSINGGMHMY